MQNLPRNYRRRSLGVAICLSPVGVLVASILCGTTRQTGSTTGLTLVLLAAFIAAFNFHLSFFRPLLYLRSHGSLTGYRFISGVPIVGTFFLLVGVLASFGDVVIAWVGLGVLLADTLSPIWFLIMTWKDSSLWDA